MEMLTCPLCTNKAQRKYTGHTGYQLPEVFDIYHCSSCMTAFSHPQKVDEDLYNVIYSNIEKVPGYARYFKYANQVLLEKDPFAYLSNNEDVYWGIQKFLQNKQKKLKILEVGSGFGYLTYALSKRGYDVTGMDISQVAVAAAKKRYGDYYVCADIIEYSQNSIEKYDVIILTEVIEHIPNVKPFLKALDDLLHVEGNIVLTTPNKSAYPEDVLWETEPPPIHLWWFSENSIQHLARELGHSVIFIDFTEYNKMDPIRPDISMREFKPTRQARLDSSGKVIMGKLRALLYDLGLFFTAIKIKNFIQRKTYNIKIKLKNVSLEKKRTILCAIIHKSKKESS